MNNAIIILLLVAISVTSFAADIKIVAEVDGEIISTLDLDKRMKLAHTLHSNNINLTPKQALNLLIDEYIVTNEAKKLNIQLSDKELDNAITLFFTKNFKIHANQISKYAEKQKIDLNVLTTQVKSQLLWHKIIATKVAPHINVSNNEMRNAKEQIERPEYIVVFQEFYISSNENKNMYVVADDLVKKMRNKHAITHETLDSAIKMEKKVVNLNKLQSNIKNILEGLNTGDISDPLALSNGYLIVNIIDKIQLSYHSLESTFKLKQVNISSLSQEQLDMLRKETINCSNFDSIISNLNLPKAKSFEANMRDLSPEMQLLLVKANINEVLEINDNDTSKFIILCEITSNENISTDAIKHLIYRQKVTSQSNLLLSNMRKNTVIKYCND